jgi:hypothetical protein
MNFIPVAVLIVDSKTVLETVTYSDPSVVPYTHKMHSFKNTTPHCTVI